MQYKMGDMVEIAGHRGRVVDAGYLVRLEGDGVLAIVREQEILDIVEEGGTDGGGAEDIRREEQKIRIFRHRFGSVASSSHDAWLRGRSSVGVSGLGPPLGGDMLASERSHLGGKGPKR